MEAKRLRRVVIKEELFALTGDTIEAIILGQLMYWQERVKDFDKFIEEERERATKEGEECNAQPLNGWIYKTAGDMVADCMLNISDVTMRKYLVKLCDKGYIESRKNPRHKWDKTLQYRVNVARVIEAVQAIGYDGIGGYSLRTKENESSNLINLASIGKNLGSSERNLGAIPEITNIDYTKDNTQCATKVADGGEKKSDYKQREAYLKEIYTDPLFAPFGEWLKYKISRRENYKTVAALKIAFKRLKELSGCKASTATKIVEQSIANGWKGLFALKQDYNRQKADPRIEPQEHYDLF